MLQLSSIWSHVIWTYKIKDLFSLFISVFGFSPLSNPVIPINELDFIIFPQFIYFF